MADEALNNIKDKLYTDADAAYERMAHEARVNKALVDLAEKQHDAAAGTGRKAVETTIMLRGENNTRNVIGKARKLQDDYKKNIDTALEKLRIRQEAQQGRDSAASASRESASRLSQRRFDAEFGLRREQFDLDKSGSDFNRAYRLYANRLINRNAFTDITGISVKNLPARKKTIVRPAVVQDSSPQAKTVSADGSYRAVEYTNAYGAKRHIYVKNDVYDAAKKNGVYFTDNHGNPKDNITLMKEIFGSQSNIGMIKAGTDKVNGISDYKNYAMLPDTNSGKSSQYFFVSNDLINAAREMNVPLYESGQLKTEQQLLKELGSNDWWIKTSDYLKNNRDEIVEMFGADDYNILNAYVFSNALYTPFENVGFTGAEGESGGISLDEAMADVDALALNAQYKLETLGEEEYYKQLGDALNELELQSDKAAAIQKGIIDSGNAYAYSDVEALLPEYARALVYENTDEDYMRKAMGVVPASFDAGDFENRLQKKRMDTDRGIQPEEIKPAEKEIVPESIVANTDYATFKQKYKIPEEYDETAKQLYLEAKTPDHPLAEHDYFQIRDAMGQLIGGDFEAMERIFSDKDYVSDNYTANRESGGEKNITYNISKEEPDYRLLLYPGSSYKEQEGSARIERILKAQQSPSDNFEIDLFYVVYGYKPDAEEIGNTLQRLGLRVYGTGNIRRIEEKLGLEKPQLSDADKLFVNYYNETIDSIYDGLDSRRKSALREDIADYVSYSGVDTGGNVEGYRRIFEDVYGYYPKTDDMIALSNRLRSENVSGRTPEGRNYGGGGVELNEQDRQFLEQAQKYAIASVSGNTAIARLNGQSKEAITEMVGGAAGRGSDAFLTGLESTGLAGFEMLGGYFIDNNAPGRMRRYVNEMKEEKTRIYGETLKATPNYAPWMTAGQDIGAGIVTTFETVIAGQIAGAVSGATSGSVTLANPALSKTFVETIAPSTTLKTMFFQQYGENLSKYENMDAGGMAPVYALLDAGLSTYIESLGGVMGEGSAFEAGVRALSGSKALNLALDFLEELGEESVQSVSSSALEAAASGKPIEESPSFLSSDDMLETGISVAIMVCMFGLSAKGHDTSHIEEAYKKGEFDRAAQMSLELIEETQQEGGLSAQDAEIFELVGDRLSDEISAKAEQELALEQVTDAINIQDTQTPDIARVQDVKPADAPDISQAEDTIHNAIHTLDNLGVDTAAAGKAYFDYLTAGKDAKTDSFFKAADAALAAIDTVAETRRVSGQDTASLDSLKAQVEQAKQANVKYSAEAATVKPSISGESAMADGVSLLLKLPPNVQSKADVESARKAFYESLTSGKGNKAAASEAAAGQLNKSINIALASGELSEEQAEKLQKVKAEIKGDIDSGKGVGDNENESLSVINENSNTITYRRVQGGTPPNASRIRIFIDENGRITIPSKNSNLNVSAGDTAHADYFLRKRGADAYTVEFDLPEWFDRFLKENAVPQKNYNSNTLNQGGSAPKIVDKHKPGISYELPDPWIEWLEEIAVNGRIKTKEEKINA